MPDMHNYSRKRWRFDPPFPSEEQHKIESTGILAAFRERYDDFQTVQRIRRFMRTLLNQLLGEDVRRGRLNRGEGLVKPPAPEAPFALVEFVWLDSVIAPAQRAEGWEVILPRFEYVPGLRLEGWDYVYLPFSGNMHKVGIGGTPQMPERILIRRRDS